MELIYEGKAKRVFSTDNTEELVIEYKNTATALNGLKKQEFDGKGEYNCSITCVIYDMLSSAGVPTHMIRRIDETHILVKRVEIVPLEIIVRNFAAGSFSKRYGVEEGSGLRAPALEYCLKNDELADPLISDSDIIALGVATADELAKIADIALEVNRLLTAFFAEASIKLIDYKIEVGRLPDGSIILADEISPDSCRLWDAESGEKLDKDRFRRDLGKVMDAYKEVLGRITHNC